MKFSIKDLFSKCDQIRKKLQKILNGKLHFLRSITSVPLEPFSKKYDISCPTCLVKVLTSMGILFLYTFFLN